ncbi:F0F1 ATP synthase subunit delta [Legionella israelensis]|uniref:ATP synthase subunit delta n=1 Tax=Legionella israelensis TaxID=454 RepID=A0A0W0V1P9_9GAMM|nr:F0F1 ATP synthase subunit delta [Legionella israelensis]KTD14031.1 ATP synthase F1 subunit delta [Legionella israelensis]QBS09687.1 F0F1 ATP synthase subunit delta [Legionella israelensis]SCY04242.1 ATP synthase F1 subcomplex delta subunit [Legionella israelensis DSM 19235]STX60622.1 ATP synthase F1 subunit delta [Legionella israelensis]
MSDSTTIARPYAKAIFEHALDKNKLPEWSKILHVLAESATLQEAADFISNPEATDEQRIELLMTVVRDKYSNESDLQAIHNLLCLLAHNKRLLLLPDIKVLYEMYRAEQEKTLSVDIVSFSKPSDSQLQQLGKSLSQRLQRKVSLNTKIDPSILGGAIIYAGDLVIDGSVRGKLNKLKADLTA